MNQCVQRNIHRISTIGQNADTYLDDNDCPAAFRMRSIARGFFKSFKQEEEEAKL